MVRTEVRRAAVIGAGSAKLDVETSYAACEALARANYENFPVASRLLPRHLRKHVAAIYAFARTADDIADEPGREPAERLALLAALHAAVAPLGRTSSARARTNARRDETERGGETEGRSLTGGKAAEATAKLDGTEGRSLPGEDAVPFTLSVPKSLSVPAGAVVPPPAFRLPPPDLLFFLPALADTVTRFNLPASLLTDLLSAFTQDVTTTRYETWDEVIDYCRRSADPVGRLVLRLNGYDDPALDRASDAVCTALQLTNFWQDLAVDWSRG
ncbi:MAG: squalene/phytoene synthase family protein, partial [Acidobacteria bacterium]|nr:squalene/phytoene synthase family protein [Acidobacteriota bacterium]